MNTTQTKLNSKISAHKKKKGKKASYVFSECLKFPIPFKGRLRVIPLSWNDSNHASARSPIRQMWKLESFLPV